MIAGAVHAQSAANPQELSWDPGLSEQGTLAVAQPATTAGTYYYRINTRAAEVWRTKLTVTSGEANMYLCRGSLPVKGQVGTIAVERLGSDGTLFGPPSFAPGQDWFIMVEAVGTRSTWTLATGDAYVRDLGNLPYTDTNLDGSYTIGEPSQDGGVANLVFPPEGVLFFKTTLPSNVPAWSLWLKGGTQVMGVRKNKVPILFETNQTVDRKQNGNLLLVPPYLGFGSDSYFISVVGEPGAAVSLDSRIQQVEDMAFGSAVPPFAVTGVPYRVFRVDVPAGLTVWDVSLGRLSGDPNLAVKKETVPCETENDAVSEALGEANDSVSLVAPYLTNGKWFVTVYSPLAYETGLANGEPVVSDVGFRAQVNNDQPSRAGWKYYRVPDFAAQVGTLGWQLNLSNAPSGTQLAIRRAQVPGSWKRRTGGSSGLTTVSYSDFQSGNGILQRVDHEADIWYVGVYQPDKELGNFLLSLNDIVATQSNLNGSASVVTDQIEGEWKYFRIVIPDDPNLLGWYLDLTAVTGAASPKISVRRDRLPPAASAPSSSGWPTGAGLVADADFTGVMTDPGNLAVNGQRFLSIKGPGRQLEPGTYYVGVLAGAAVPTAGSTNKASYTLRSRGIGAGYALEVTPLDLNNGSVSTGSLAARDFRFFSVTIPEGVNVPSVRMALSPTVGEMFMQVRRESLPDFTTSALVGGPPSVTGMNGGKRMKRAGAESLIIAPENGASSVFPGTYYIAAISEGVSPSATVMGTGSATGTLSSTVPATVTDLGALNVSSPLARPFDLAGGDMAIYTFTVPSGMKVLEASLSERVGNPGISMFRGAAIPIPFPGNSSGNSGYGWVGGQNVATHPVLLSEQDPVAGQITLVVRANTATNGSLVQSTGVLNIRLVATIPALHLLSGPKASTVSGQISEGWKYFELTVPSDARIKGIRVSLKDVSSGVPRMVIRKGTKMPKDFVTSSGLGSSATAWATDQQWAPTKDFTNLAKDSTGVIASGRYFLSAYGAPMDAGTYIIGVSKDSSINTVSNPATPNMNYRLVVEAIGDTVGDGIDLPIKTIGYDNTATPEQIVNLPEREINFYKVIVPEDSPSWRVRLQTGLSADVPPKVLDGSFAVRRGKIPAFDALLDPFVGGGANVRMLAVDDHWVLLPKTTTGLIEKGEYFIAVTSFGAAPKVDQSGAGPSSLTLLSRGALPVVTFPSLAVDAFVSKPYNLGPGEVAAYQLTVPPPGVDGIPYGLALDINRTSGSANYSILLLDANGRDFPVPPGKGNEGFSGGLTSLAVTTDDIGGRLFFQILQGTYRVIVRSTLNPQNTYGAASGTLEAKLLLSSETPTVAFDGGNLSVSGAGASTDFLQYRVEIPDEPNWVAWGLRLDPPVSGKPQVYIRRGQPMATPVPPSVSSDMIDWPLGHQWTQMDDFTKLRHDPPGPTSSGGDKDRQYQYFFAARERPLQPGTYYIGIDNRGTSTISPRSFTIRTFAVGDGYTIPLRDLSESGTSLPVVIPEPRMMATFKMAIPPNSRAWSVALSPSLGDMTLRVRYAGMPDPVNETSTPAYPDTKGGVHIQKLGGERFTLLPKPGQSFLQPGDYYFVVASDGQGSVPSSGLVGSGQVEGTITNLGPLGVTDLGTVGAVGISQPISLAAAEVQVFNIDVPAGINNLQFRLNNRSGESTFAVTQGTRIPAPGISESYGVFGGETTTTKGTIVNDMSNPAPGTYTIAVRAAGTGSNYSAASATLVVGEVKPVPLNFAQEINSSNGLSNSDRRTLADKEKFFYKVPVPRQINGQDVLGWLLVLDQGTPIVRIYKSPNDFGKTAPVSILSGRRSALIVPPFLTFDTYWYIEVEGVGTSDYILRSQPVVLSAPAWTMPSAFNQLIGDSNPGSPDGQGIGRSIAQDMWDFFAIDVPENNLGLLRMVLEQYNGNPNVYISDSGIPSPDHSSNGTSISTTNKLYRYKMTDIVSEVGNFSEPSSTTSPPDRLKPGRWYVGVKAENGSSNYRLKAHSGVVTDLNLTTAAPLTGQDLAAKDWRYYRFTVPRTGIPAQWNPFFERVSGSSVAYIRDTLPPFSYDASTSLTPGSPTFADWSSDGKNKVPTTPTAAYVKAVVPGTLSLAPSPLRPGSTYFLGFYGANSGGGVDVSSSVSGGTMAIDAESPWNTGVIQIAVPANQSRLVRVSTDADATRFKIQTQHSALGISVKLEQGAPPSTAVTVTPHLQNTTALPQSYLINQSLVGQSWPWYPGKDYYLRLTNTTNQDIVSTLTMQGRNAATEDEDQDELLDIWERQYFGLNLNAQGPNGDPDGDGSTNLQEQQNGTSPTDATSVRYILSALAPGGGLTITPLQPHYASGSVVGLTATPALGDVFREWKSSDPALNGSTNPVQSTSLTANRSATAIFQTSLTKALDTPASTVWTSTSATTTSGLSSQWYGQYEVHYDGDAAASPSINYGQQSRITTSFQGPGTLTFWWKVSSKTNQGILALLVNNEPPTISISGITDWAKVTIRIEEGSRRTPAAWRYSRTIDLATAGENRAFVDQVQFVPDNQPVNDLAAWKAGNFTPTELSNPAVSGPSMDPDGDGIPNLIEAAIGSSPKSRNPAGFALTIEETSTVGGQRTNILSAHRAEVPIDDIQLEIQASTSLDSGNWISLARKTGNQAWVKSSPSVEAITEASPAVGAVPVTLDERVPEAGSSRRFFRLHATQVTP